ncbi:MAG: hypothetical protein ACYTFG_09900 [Planctomycetota bacterium]|jgi:hypothetical protein
MKTTNVLLAFLFLALGSNNVHAQKGRRLNLPWEKDAKEAVKNAKAAKKPMAVCFIQKKCRLSMHMVKALHDDGRIYDLTKKFVWLCVDPSRRDDFKWFLAICGDAVEGTPTIFFLNEKGQYADPKLAGIDPVSGADPSRIIASLRSVLGRFKQDLTDEDKSLLKSKLDEARAAAEKKPAEALALFREVIRTGEGWTSMEETTQAAREGLEKLLQTGMEKIRRILAKRMKPQDAMKALIDLAASYPDSAVSAWCKTEADRKKKEAKKAK